MDELIVPDFTLGTVEQTLATYDQLIAEVAPSFR